MRYKSEWFYCRQAINTTPLQFRHLFYDMFAVGGNIQQVNTGRKAWEVYIFSLPVDCFIFKQQAVDVQ